ncbi:MAG: YdcF family protein [Anaerolineales bacterium]|nr:YdcF family protein [Anaerolineales bacterium]
MTKYDCIFIPGGGLLPNGSLPPWTLARLERAKALKSHTRWIAFLSGGTVHKPPPLNENGYPIFESRAAAEYLVQQGVDAAQLLTEISSYDTIGNAYFSRLLFAEPIKMQQLLVITSDFHLPRTQAVFEWIYCLTPLLVNYQLGFESVPDRGLSPKTLKARIAREKKSLEKMRETQLGITSLAAFQSWFYSQHTAYAVTSQPDKAAGDVLESY